MTTNRHNPRRYIAAPPAAVLFLSFCLLVIFPRGELRALEFSGFIKNFLVGQHIPQFQSLPETDVAAPGGETLVANNLRFRADMTAQPLPWLSLGLSYNFVPRWQDNQFATLLALAEELSRTIYRIGDLDAFLYPGSPTADDNFVILQNLDRAYALLEAPQFDLLVGRQAVNWGSSRVINPTDVIAPFLITEIDTENRIGVDAVRARIPAGDLGEVDIGYVAGEDAIFKNSALYGRSKFYHWSSDLSVILMQFRQQTMLGMDVARAIRGAGTWLEAASVWVSEAARSSVPLASAHVNPAWYLRLSAGADYSPTNNTYVFLEYHFNSAGANSTSDYRLLASTPAYTDGNVYLLGQHYLTPGISWQASALWSLTASSLVNVTDGSLLLTTVVEYNWLENIYASAGTFLGLGSAPTYNPTSGSSGGVEDTLDPNATEFHSEFGTYPSTLYAALRYYY